MTKITVSLLRVCEGVTSIHDAVIEDPYGTNWVVIAREFVAEHYPGWKIISIQTWTEGEALEAYEVFEAHEK